MTTSIWDWTAAKLLDATASDAPTPGGGAVATASAALGVGLVLMALRVTARKRQGEDTLGPPIEAGVRLMEQLTELADADTAVFQGYMDALKLPRATDDEKAARRTALQQAARDATEVPLTAAQTMLEALTLAAKASALSDGGIVSDVAAGAALLHGALTAVLYNVDINLKSLKDADAVADYARSRDHLRARGQERYAAIAAACSDRLRGE